MIDFSLPWKSRLEISYRIAVAESKLPYTPRLGLTLTVRLLF